MKITKDIYIKATAEAMSKGSTQKFFKVDSQAFDMFSLFSFILFNRLEGKDVTEDDFIGSAATIILGALPDSNKRSTMIKNLALIILSLQIWEELKKQDKSDGNNPEYDSFKTELNSKL